MNLVSILNQRCSGKVDIAQNENVEKKKNANSTEAELSQ